MSEFFNDILVAVSTGVFIGGSFWLARKISNYFKKKKEDKK